MEFLKQDVRFSCRSLLRSPGFTIAAVGTLALAIGANALVFGVMDALILRPLNVPQAQTLFVVEPHRASDKSDYESYLNYLDLRDRNGSFNGLAAYNISQAGLDTGNNPSRSWLFEVSGNYFDVLGVQPYLGRFFHTSDEHGPNSAPFIVITEAYWRSHFHSDRGVIGRTVQLNKHPFTIIGVASPGFKGTFQIFAPDFFVPIVNREQVDGDNILNVRANRWVMAMEGHLKAGVTTAQATADLNSIAAYLAKTYPKDEDKVSFSLGRPGVADLFGGAMRMFLTGLTLLAGLILLAACANLGSLFAARAADRSREVALRLALGSPRSRILRQLFTEAILISLVGGAAGLCGSVVLLHELSVWQPFPQFPINIPVRPDAYVYLVALLLNVASGLLFGAVPVMQVLRTNPYEIVKATAGGIGRRVTLRDVLLVAQIAICAVLVTASMVAVRGLARTLHSKLGVEPENAMLAETDLRMAGYSDDKVPAMERRMIDTMKTIPGVTFVGLASSPPLHMGWEDLNVFSEEATDLKPSNAAADAITFQVSPEYFQAAGTALLMGRTFTLHDDKNAPHVAVVNVKFARKIFGSPDKAMGQYYKMQDGTKIQVVGIVEDGKYTANLAEDPQLAMFLPILQSSDSDVWLVLRTNRDVSRDPQQVAAAIRSKLRDVDPGLPVFLQTWNEEMNGALFAERMATIALGILGIMGAILSIIGIFGMAAYSVTRRLRELGIRIALGAQRREVLQAALGRALKLLTLGSVVGLVLGILASRVLAFIVYQATPRDPLVLGGVVLAMLLLGLLGTWIPAQRALSVKPLVLLRDE